MNATRTMALALCIWTVSACCAWAAPAAAANDHETYSPSQLQRDIQFVAQTIHDVHPRFRKGGSALQALDAKLRALGASLHHGMTREALFVRLAPIVAGLGDGHTHVLLPWADLEPYLARGGTVFPFDVVFVDGKLYVYRSYARNDRIAPGCRILSINGVSAATVRDNLAAMLAGPMRFRHRRMDGTSDFFKALLLLRYGWGSSFTIEYRSGGQVERAQVHGVTKARLDHVRSTVRETGKPVSLRIIRPGVALLDIRSFSSTHPDAFKRSVRGAFKQLAAAHVDNLIVDIRNNAGGDSGLVKGVLGYLASRPFALMVSVQARASRQFKAQMKKRVPAALRWLPLQYLSQVGRRIWDANDGSLVRVQPDRVRPASADIRFSGHVYVLIGNGTFSAATVFAAAVARNHLGVLVGRESGGRAGTFFGQPLSLQLPETGLTLNVASMVFNIGARTESAPDTGVTPDVIVPRSVRCALPGTDCVLQRALERIATRANAVVKSGALREMRARGGATAAPLKKSDGGNQR